MSKPKRNKKPRYVNHDGWPELRKRLEKELLLFESFSFEPEVNGTTESAFNILNTLGTEHSPALRSFYCQIAYTTLFRYFPIIKLKVSEQMLESWLINHSVDELKQLINYKENET